MTYVHPFIFSLATIIHMPPDEVLWKGSGTLCTLWDAFNAWGRFWFIIYIILNYDIFHKLILTIGSVQAYKANVICRNNKHLSDPKNIYSNRLLESGTYTRGHVECLESRVLRCDLPTSFKLDLSAFKVCVAYNNLLILNHTLLTMVFSNSLQILTDTCNMQ